MYSSIVVTLGDMNGIGPELLLKVLHSELLPPDCRMIIIAPETVLRYYGERFNLPVNVPVISSREFLPQTGHVVYDSFTEVYHPVPGKISAKAGSLSILALDIALELISEGFAHGLVTAPISKEAIHMAGYSFPGHTEYLSEKTASKEVTMMLVSGGLRVALVSAHVPLSMVPMYITSEHIYRKLVSVYNSLKTDFGIEKPTIAVLGLNPHAGDGGVLGTEENEYIEPAIAMANQQGISCSGPFPADGWFGMQQYEHFDAVLAMYHDQGLAPFKALSFGRGVNFSAGLPIIRTSPDHGTAFAIAGQNLANTDSIIEALKLSFSLTQKRFV
jgi:4-hydroxythreonine-4-phosphate dehydrogenase